MAASKGTYLRNAIYDAINRNTAFTGAVQLYLSYHTAAPGLAGANEVAGNAYARVALAMADDGGDGSGANSAAATTAAPSPAAWGTLTHFGVWDALTVGNYYYGDALTSPIVTSIGVPVTAPVGNLSYSET